MGITFEYKDVKYEAPEASYDDNKFVLPDGCLIEATSWTEGELHIPLTFVEIPYAEIASDLVELANRFEAVLTIVAEQ